MPEIPFEIPESLNSYVKTFEESPEKGIANLEAYLARRRNDAVGFFLLAVLYASHEKGDAARKAASRARALAPGSHLLEHLHYFLSHPDGFKAWVPRQSDVAATPGRSHPSASTLSVDLDVLISRLTRAGSKRIEVPSGGKPVSRGEDDKVLSDLATPTLAGIYEAQLKFEEAIAVYERLIAMRPSQKGIYENEIERIRTLLS